MLAAIWAIAVAVGMSFPSSAQRAVAQQEKSGGLDVVQLRPNFYVIAGAGGNIVVQTGPEGVILVDSGSTAMADEVLATIRRLTPLPIRYIINTSMDPDPWSPTLRVSLVTPVVPSWPVPPHSTP
jgi:glyoxylase-like metal-dependent hydrolase (beta-lactamase superfamily II)